MSNCIICYQHKKIEDAPFIVQGNSICKEHFDKWYKDVYKDMEWYTEVEE